MKEIQKNVLQFIFTGYVLTVSLFYIKKRRHVTSHKNLVKLECLKTTVTSLAKKHFKLAPQ